MFKTLKMSEQPSFASKISKVCWHFLKIRLFSSPDTFRSFLNCQIRYSISVYFCISCIWFDRSFSNSFWDSRPLSSRISTILLWYSDPINDYTSDFFRIVCLKIGVEIQSKTSGKSGSGTWYLPSKTDFKFWLKFMSEFLMVLEYF